MKWLNSSLVMSRTSIQLIVWFWWFKFSDVVLVLVLVQITFVLCYVCKIVIDNSVAGHNFNYMPFLVENQLLDVLVIFLHKPQLRKEPYYHLLEYIIIVLTLLQLSYFFQCSRNPSRCPLTRNRSSTVSIWLGALALPKQNLSM